MGLNEDIYILRSKNLLVRREKMVPHRIYQFFLTENARTFCKTCSMRPKEPTPQSLPGSLTQREIIEITTQKARARHN
jgi:hypothetical protein